MPICILPLSLSSQISAGEVIDRPDSVVKEIIENSIDAGSKNINIEIENNGFKSILVKDDGCGINRKELLFAITRHATSKINSLSDLESIDTFGFRGEALASIRAVSRLTIISCTHLNEIGWKIYSEGSEDHNIILQPIAHPLGTTVIVENLFYNMLIRLKFIKNRKLEFLKIYEVVKRIALSQFNIGFTLKHNGKLIANYNSLKNNENKCYRLKNVFNIIETDKLIKVKSNLDDMLLFGWITYSKYLKKFKNIEYCYVNNRYTQKSIFYKAVRSAFFQIIENIKMSFVLYLKMPSNKVDINIHPTKNEIQFNESKLIYAFIYQTILNNLKNNSSFFKNKIKKNVKQKDFSDSLKPFFFINSSSSVFSKKCNLIKDQKDSCSFLNLLIIVKKYYGLIYNKNNFLLISFPLAQAIIKKKKLENEIKKKIKIEYFMTNIKLNVTHEEYILLFKNQKILLKFGFCLMFLKNSIILITAPNFFKKNRADVLILDFFVFLFLKKKVLIKDIINWFYLNIFLELKSWNYMNGVLMLLEIERFHPFLFNNPPSKLLQRIDIKTALRKLKI